MKRKAPQEVLFEFDGPGVAPETVDTLAFLRLAEAFFSMMLRVADAQKLGLTFRGIEIRDKCIAAVARPSNMASARIAARGTKRVVGGTQKAPSGAEGLQVEIQKLLRELVVDTNVSVRIGKQVLGMRAPDPVLVETPWETTELRVYALRVSAKGENPRAELASDSEAQPFTLNVSLDDARKLGNSLLSKVDVVVTICRGADGSIAGGKVIRVFDLQEQDVANTWRKWFADTGDWDQVEDVRGELGRN